MRREMTDFALCFGTFSLSWTNRVLFCAVRGLTCALGECDCDSVEVERSTIPISDGTAFTVVIDTAVILQHTGYGLFWAVWLTGV